MLRSWDLLEAKARSENVKLDQTYSAEAPSVLAADFDKPTYLTYDQVLNKMYVCDEGARAIYGFPVTFSD